MDIATLEGAIARLRSGFCQVLLPTGIVIVCATKAGALSELQHELILQTLRELSSRGLLPPNQETWLEESVTAAAGISEDAVIINDDLALDFDPATGALGWEFEDTIRIIAETLGLHGEELSNKFNRTAALRAAAYTS